MSTPNQLAPDRQQAEAEGARLSSGLAGRIATVRSGLTPRTIAYGAVVAFALLVTAVISTALLVKDEAATDFNLASFKSGEAPLVLIRFSSQATELQINTFLGAYQAEVVSGPRRGNFYDVRITGQPSPAEIARIVRQMQNETGIVDLAAEKE